jgi:hypothetical protein
MQRRRVLAEIAAGAVILLPPPGDEVLGLALGAAIMKGHNQMDETTSDLREARRGGGSAPARTTTIYVGLIVIGAVVVLAIMAGAMPSLVQH